MTTIYRCSPLKFDHGEVGYEGDDRATEAAAASPVGSLGYEREAGQAEEALRGSESR
jgi:hypothetical protein